MTASAAEPLTTARLRHPPRARERLARIGDPHARLLAGSESRESLSDHLARLGDLPRWPARHPELLETIRRSGLTGRGGGHFPLARKLEATLRGTDPAVVVVNGTESEPASAKDQLLLQLRPHLVIDGALTVAAACAASDILIAVHAGSAALRSITTAIEERDDCATVGVSVVPNRYIAGESSSLVSWLGGGPAVPASRSRPTAECGLYGRPTVVSNTESVCHVAMLARHGDSWFREAGPWNAPGSLLITVAGDVAVPGTVLEVLHPVSISDLLAEACGPDPRWQAALIGGYGGTWVSREEASSALVQPGKGVSGSVGIGCGLIGVVGPDRCGLAEASRIVSWLAAQRAGQCGACSYGLPLVAEELDLVARGGRSLRRSQRKVASLAHLVAGRGLCSLPDSTIAMAESSLVVFGHEADLHRRGRCTTADEPGAFPLPSLGGRQPG